MQCAGERASLDNLPGKTDIYQKVQHYNCRRALSQDEGCGLKRLPSVTPINPPLYTTTNDITTELYGFTMTERERNYRKFTKWKIILLVHLFQAHIFVYKRIFLL